jgi:uncharacterized membrane protein
MTPPDPAHGSSRPDRASPDRIGLALGLLSLAYPVIALLLARPLGPTVIVLAMCAALALRVVFGLGRRTPLGMTLAGLATAAALAITTAFDAELAMRLYPLFMNAAMLAAFAHTLWKPPSMIERFARLVEPDLPEAGVRYTRKVTWVWCAFLLINGAIALWTALYATLEVWALYNGLIAYVLMGTLFGAELLVRAAVKRAASREARP